MREPHNLCERCGHPIQIGQYPFCKGNPPDHEPHRATGIAGDDIPGGVWLENYGPHPVKVYSHTERRRLMNTVQYDKTTGQPYILTEKDNFAPMPGTDKDAQGIPNPNGFRSLAAAEILARNGRTLDEDETRDSLGGGSRLDRTDANDVPNDPGYRDGRVEHFNFTTEDRDLLQKVRGTDG